MAKKSTIHMTISEASLKRLENLKYKTESDATSEVVANALRLYEWMIDQVEQGNEHYLKRVDGSFAPSGVFGVAGRGIG